MGEKKIVAFRGTTGSQPPGCGVRQPCRIPPPRRTVCQQQCSKSLFSGGYLMFFLYLRQIQNPLHNWWLYCGSPLRSSKNVQREATTEVFILYSTHYSTSLDNLNDFKPAQLSRGDFMGIYYTYVKMTLNKKYCIVNFLLFRYIVNNVIHAWLNIVNICDHNFK